ncbi:flagellar hook-length control protein FliK [Cupriavidus consociatus]|uniref:flagellar hook-length control protein FliK n=1 Tax=Cupriavidus consociatus TaxID=2821357 RepID=UPI001AE58320|nr:MULTISPECIES: flagellar hook-length control protein FliK [unclassified Cupriavidus]MBP0619899.1 flagellar hook-length control protein FliK [Cupriavidus sp. LEh25]MDK2656554.1 flagellar hook-length control protein FliK [Cupriavidus sp. LEh21]
MTGIHLPPGLAPGQAPDPQLLRPALAIDKLAALQPVLEATEANVQNSTGQAIRHSQQAAGANAMPAQGALLPGTSTRESLSSAARAILAVMESAGPQPVKPGTPLLPAPPAAGSMQAAAAALANAVGQSGLFYESHLAQWMSGARPLSTILQEPQAAVPRPALQGAPGQAAASQSQASASAMLTYSGPAGGDAPRLSNPPLLPASQVLAEALASPRNPRVAHSHAPSEQGVRQGTGSAAVYSRDADTPPQRPSTGMLAAQAYQATADAARPATAESMAGHAARTGDTDSIGSEAARQAAPAGPAIHPATEGVVRQQLELLATQQFRFAGEAWPGAAMEWDIQRTDPEAHGQGPDDASRPWSSRIRLQLPNLGTVEALLTLGPSGLEARVATGETDIAARLIAARPLLRNRLEAQGIPLQRLNIQTQDDLSAGAAS